MTARTTAYLSLGSNVGDRAAHLRHAIMLLSDAPGLSVSRVAGMYETEPVGVRNQPWFLNTVVEVATELPPRELLAAAKQVERVVGRAPSYRWGPREIDVDILLYGDVKWDDEELTIPHPRMKERLFVLQPLRDLLPDWQDENGETINTLIDRIRGTAEVRQFREGA